MNTPDNITELKPNEIFVFGSNLWGLHDGGAAKTALEKFGAVYANPVGPQGQSYAIPTIKRDMHPMHPYSIKRYASDFIDYAKNHPDLTFYLTKVGCGIAGYSEQEIAPLFKDTPENVIKPEGW